MRYIDYMIYIKLDNIITEIEKTGRKLTSEEKETFAEAITNNITPYEACSEMGDPYDTYNNLWELYNMMDDSEILEKWLDLCMMKTVEDYVFEYGFPIPGRDDMIEKIIDYLDLEEYIDENCDDYIDVYYEQIIYNLTDNEIIQAFNTYVNTER